MIIRRLQQRDFAPSIAALAAGATAWTAWTPKPAGLIGYSPVPGLPNLADMLIYVRPSQRRRGVGTRLLDHLLDALQSTPQAAIAIAATPSQKVLVAFLQARGFAPEHEEWDLLLTLPSFASSTADLVEIDDTSLIRRLYDDSFAGVAWYQPYDCDDDLREQLGSHYLYYVMPKEGRPIGFAAVALRGDHAEIEPFGIVAAYQGQGYGRVLLNALLSELTLRQVKAVKLSVWRSNAAALQLYLAAGFRRTSSRRYYGRAVR